MKIAYDKAGRKLYKFSHSVHQGGFLYAHRTTTNSRVTNKEGLRNVLTAIALSVGLIDVTVKVYENGFFFFFLMRPSTAAQRIIDMIQKNIPSFAEWEGEYLWTGVYDLQEKYVREELARRGYDFDAG